MSFVDGLDFSADFDLNSFCESCGTHRRRMPFGSYSAFFDRDPCPSCGEHGPGNQVVSRRTKVGRWFWQRGWIDRTGLQVDCRPPVTDGGDGR